MGDKVIGVVEKVEKKTTRSGSGTYAEVTINGKRYSAWDRNMEGVLGLRVGETAELDIQFSKDGKYANVVGCAVQTGTPSAPPPQGDVDRPQRSQTQPTGGKDVSIVMQVAFKIARDVACAAIENGANHDFAWLEANHERVEHLIDQMGGSVFTSIWAHTDAVMKEM